MLKKQKKKYSSDDGIIKIDLKKGRYTLRIRGLGFQEITKEIIVTKEKTVFSFELDFLRTQGGEISIISGKAKQTLGRNSLSKKDIKNTPGSLGDALGVVISLPGVIRSGRFFGELLLRGSPEQGNSYLVDGILLLSPQHFGGLQFIVSNEIIKTLDIYSSNAPLDFGQTYGGVISVDTKDKVEEFSAYVDISALYLSAYLEGVFIEKNLLKGGTDRKFGFWIASGRLGYAGFTVFPLLRSLLNRPKIPTPQYFDYQLKFVFWLDQYRKHELTTLLVASGDVSDGDFFDENQGIVINEEQSTSSLYAQFNNVISFIYQYSGLDWLTNQVKLYTSLPIHLNSYTNNTTDFYFEDLIFFSVTAIENLLSIPFFFTNFNLDISSLVAYRLHTFLEREKNRFSGISSILGDVAFEEVESIFRGYNHTLYGFLKVSFEGHGFEGEFGSRIEYLERTGEVVFDPRGIISYSFPIGMKISTVTGLYHSFPQVNVFYFNRIPGETLQISIDDVVNAERSWQSSTGIEQKFLELYFVKFEGFYNYIPNRIRINDEAGNLFINKVQHRVYGLEFFLKKKLSEGKNDFYGWLSYTYSVSQEKINLITDSSEDKFTPFNSDITHALKLVAGYKFKRHEVGIRFELLSGSRYTPIVGSRGRCTIMPCSNSELITSYIPVYGDRNSAIFPLTHHLDIRYTYIRNYNWGIFKFYIDIINAYYYLSPSRQTFQSNQPFTEGINPVLQGNELDIPILPSFGFELTF